MPAWTAKVYDITVKISQSDIYEFIMQQMDNDDIVGLMIELMHDKEISERVAIRLKEYKE